MRFSYIFAILALFAATTQAFSTGAPKCEASDAVLNQMQAKGTMGTKADEKTFSPTWPFELQDQDSKPVKDIKTNAKYSVIVKGGKYKGVMVYPMLDEVRAKKADVDFEPGPKNFKEADCADEDGPTVTHSSMCDLCLFKIRVNAIVTSPFYLRRSLRKGQHQRCRLHHGEKLR
jgi:hypothetical protein